ncbi:unnamed protein product [Eruca vesicaria subsp. sativa]|uniref:Uncharacterized protein n=1 Tax=Eruca vesicaria subsp. sativa TaxID=29727 RepID=A0ABC8LII8_ERUVS|nr:unnamed protein product [Eruca vesicaria subsp. sativa]
MKNHPECRLERTFWLDVIVLPNPFIPGRKSCLLSQLILRFSMMIKLSLNLIPFLHGRLRNGIYYGKHFCPSSGMLRVVAFGAMWILIGKRVCFSPTFLKELFRFWPNKDEEPPKWTSRLFYTVVALVVVMLLRRHAPDEVARARYQRKMPNIIDDAFEWSPKLALSGLMENQPPVNNITEATNNSSHAAVLTY